jgi:hypothetical protein
MTYIKRIMPALTAILLASPLASQQSGIDVLINRIRSSGTYEVDHACGETTRSYSLNLSNLRLNGVNYEDANIVYFVQPDTTIMATLMRFDRDRGTLRFHALFDEQGGRPDGIADKAFQDTLDIPEVLRFLADMIENECRLAQEYERRARPATPLDQRIYRALIEAGLRRSVDSRRS